MIVKLSTIIQCTKKYLRIIPKELVLLLIIDAFVLYRLRNFLLDDAFFGYSYARNLASGIGFVFNSGEKVIGTSSPLMALIYGVLTRYLGGEVIIWAKIIGALFFIWLTMVTFLLFKKWIQNTSLAFVGVWLFIAHPYVIFLFSHESLVYITLAITSLYLWGNGQKNIANILLGLGVLVRQEMVILWLVLIFFEFIRTLKDRLSLLDIFYKGVIFSGIWVGWFMFSKYYYGEFFSASFYAKSIQPELGIQHFMRGFIMYNFDLTKTYKPALIYYLGVALLFVPFIKQVAIEWKVLHIPLIWVGVITTFYIATNMPFYHWFAPQLYFLFATIYIFALKNILLENQAMNSGSYIVKRFGLAVLVFALIGVVGLSIRSTVTLPSSTHHLYKEIGLWLNQNTPENASVSYGEIGLIKYYSQRRIIDYIGMVTPDLLPLLRKKDFYAIIQAYHPDYFIYNKGFSAITGELPKQEWFTNQYSVVKTFKSKEFPFTTDIYARSADNYLGEITLRDDGYWFHFE